MVRVITTGETARLVLDGTPSEFRDADVLISEIRRCARDGIEELLIAVPDLEHGWLEVVEGGVAAAPDPLRIWLAVGDPEAVLV